MSSLREDDKEESKKSELPGEPIQDVGEDSADKSQQAQPGGQGACIACVAWRVDAHLEAGGPEEETVAAEKDDNHKDEARHLSAQPDPQEEEPPYPEPEDEEPLLPPHDFRPFFTLIEDEAGEHHHPTVHYVFTDDEDTDILTNAALQTLNDSEQPQEHDEADERFVVLDIDPTGKEVLSAKSLSPEWQSLKTHISPAPSWGGNEEGDDRGLMLRISGQEARKEASLKGKVKGDVNGLLRVFDEHLDGLTGVLGSSDDRDTQDDNLHEGDEQGAAG